MAPLAKIRRDTYPLGLKRAVRCNTENGKYLSVSETKRLVIGADEYLVTGSDFDLPRAGDVEGVRAAQVQGNFFPRRKGHDDFLFSTRTTAAEGAGRLRSGAKVTTCPGS